MAAGAGVGDGVAWSQLSLVDGLDLDIDCVNLGWLDFMDIFMGTFSWDYGIFFRYMIYLNKLTSERVGFNHQSWRFLCNKN
jgi:hypothetical protein